MVQAGAALLAPYHDYNISGKTLWPQHDRRNVAGAS